MGFLKGEEADTPPPGTLCDGRGAALQLLLDAAVKSRAWKRNRWEFAIEADQLLSRGVSASTLRALLCERLVESGVETTAPSMRRRRFKPLKNLTLPPRTCLVLTAEGERAAQQAAASSAVAHTLGSVHAVSHVVKNGRAHPRWNATSRTLFFGDQVIKRYRVPAAGQEAILNAFEEEDWPDCIDDPLPPHDGQDAKQRLHNIINALNRHHETSSSIHFSGNGNGQGIRWEVKFRLPPQVPSSKSESSSKPRPNRTRVDVKTRPNTDRNRLTPKSPPKQR